MSLAGKGEGPGGIETRPVSFIANVGYETWSSEAVVESLTGAGYDSVEWTPDHLGALRSPASALACQQDLVSRPEDAVTITLGAIESASAAGIGIINVLTGPNLWEDGADTGVDSETAWKRAVSGLERICAHATRVGVKIALEPCWGTIVPDAASADRMLAEVPVSVCFDPSHFVMTGDPIPELIRRWGDRIVHFHLKDAFGSPGMEGEDFHFCLLGEGRVPWNETFAALEAIGYEGALSVEFEAYNYLEQVLGNDPERAARLAREQVAALVARHVKSRRETAGVSGE
ncbi:MAG: sugar phosphate isomerase/epimerase [Solirubrobacterales bacterium]|nr:sugar phosphate isomerase/epimerase [Solirubrobacterales bacterium]